jgi:hypothetical protein
MAGVVVGAEPALEPVGIVADPGRRPRREDDPPRAGGQAFCLLVVDPHPLGVEGIGVLADREVERPGEPDQMHVDLHLRPVLGLGLTNAVLPQLGEGPRVVGLELQDVPGSGGFGDAEPDAIEAAAEVAAVRLHMPLPAGLGIEVEHRDADPAEVADQPLLLKPAGLEQAEHAAAMGAAGHPTEVVPERPVALPADDRGAEVLTKAVAGLRLVCRQDGFYRRASPRREGRHQAPSRCAWSAYA